MLKKLHVTTPSDTEVVMTREFDAPRPLVWDAMTKPEYLRRWCSGMPGWSLTRCEDDQRPGGKFVWEWTDPNGAFMSMTGENLEYSPPERSVRTETFVMGGFDCPPMGTQHVTMTLKEIGDRTHLLDIGQLPQRPTCTITPRRRLGTSSSTCFSRRPAGR